MARSETGICNDALGLIGVGRISSIEGQTQIERDCKSAYGLAREDVLTDFDWPFARKIKTLTRLDDETLDEFSYVYQLPPDFQSPVKIIGDKIRFKIYGDTLHCDLESDCRLVYTRNVTDPTFFSAKFVVAFQFRLAAPLAMTIKKNAKLSDQMWGYYRAIREESAGDGEASGEHDNDVVDNPYVEARS